MQPIVVQHLESQAVLFDAGKDLEKIERPGSEHQGAGVDAVELQEQRAIVAGEVAQELQCEGAPRRAESPAMMHAARFCDEVAFLSGGRVLAGGAPGEVYATDLVRDVYGVEVDLSTYDGFTEVHPRIKPERTVRRTELVEVAS